MECCPCSCTAFEEVAHQGNKIEDITRIARDMGLEDVTTEYVTECLESHD